MNHVLFLCSSLALWTSFAALIRLPIKTLVPPRVLRDCAISRQQPRPGQTPEREANCGLGLNPSALSSVLWVGQNAQLRAGATQHRTRVPSAFPGTSRGLTCGLARETAFYLSATPRVQRLKHLVTNQAPENHSGSYTPSQISDGLHLRAFIQTWNEVSQSVTSLGAVTLQLLLVCLGFPDEHSFRPVTCRAPPLRGRHGAPPSDFSRTN
jgi:hypothetical protein